MSFICSRKKKYSAAAKNLLCTIQQIIIIIVICSMRDAYIGLYLYLIYFGTAIDYDVKIFLCEIKKLALHLQYMYLHIENHGK